MNYITFDTAVGRMRLIGDSQGIRELHLKADETPFAPLEDWRESDEWLADAVQQLQAYAEGKLQRFDVRLNPQGTDFQKRVWQALSEIPFGEVRSYKDIAVAIGNPKAVRAVGGANGKNPIPVIVPCHRVIGADGTLTGFSSGLPLKKRLLALEGI